MSKTKKRLGVATLGCKVNQYDTDSVVTQFIEAGYTLVDFHDKADVYLINTCTVTNLADRKSRQMIRRAHKLNPEAKVVAMGCLAQVAPDKMAALEGVSLLVGTSGRDSIVQKIEALGRPGPDRLIEDIFQVHEFEDLSALDFSGRTRAVLKIQDGCEQFCTYCRVPYARGPSRSRNRESVLEQVRLLVANGYQEIVLTGIHLGLYGRDLGSGTADLAQITGEIADIPGLARLRLSSIDPSEVSDQLIDLVAKHPVLCRHFHLPLQSGSDDILRRMGRRYSSVQFQDVVALIRSQIPKVAITTDVMVGFPGETEQDFAKTRQLSEKLAFSKMHVFKYSRRAGTAAAGFSQQVAPNVKESRSKCLIKISDTAAEAFHKTFIGSEVDVLVEQAEAEHLIGHTDNYLRVRFKAAQNAAVGEIAAVRITAADGEEVRGVLQKEGWEEHNE